MAIKAKTSPSPGKSPKIALDDLVGAFSDPAIVIGEDHRILAANKAYAGAYGASVPEIVGRKCHEISHHSAMPCEKNGEDCPLIEVRKGSHHARAFHIHHSLGGRLFANVEVFPVPLSDGQTPLFIERIHPSAIGHPEPGADGLVGESLPFARMLADIHKVAPQSSTVLLLGETGTGKELVSQAIHQLSPRADKPFVAVDCSGLPENLIESELFGHEKGAFTGAHSRKTGLVETASGGTLFLDEIGELPLSLQAKLLRLLETNVYRRVGGIAPLRANIRLVSATHRDLPAMVKDQSFRQDLFYRLNIFPIRLPPLRERLEDVPILTASILTRLTGRDLPVRKDAMRLLSSYSYPGNIRELRNILERAWILSGGEEITPAHLPDLVENRPSSPPSFGEILPLEVMEQRYLAWAVSKAGKDLPELARTLGISLRTLYRKLSPLRRSDGDSS
ncbi:MAG: sigma 54-interacting transcriptional regulator [Nitrospirae bacterium]|nr:sigma 54-interacting transcriptional regulator [Nitrospirota bacterium]